MSLAHALNQISIGSTLDTWWSAGHAMRIHRGKKERDAANEQRRLAVLRHLISAGRPMSLHELAEVSGEPAQSVRNFAKRLEEDGFVETECIRRVTFLKAL